MAIAGSEHICKIGHLENFRVKVCAENFSVDNWKKKLVKGSIWIFMASTDSIKGFIFILI